MSSATHPEGATPRKKAAKGSEPMMWRLFEGIPRICDVCKKPLRIQDVGEHRTYRENSKEGRTVFWCKEHRGGWMPQEC